MLKLKTSEQDYTIETDDDESPLRLGGGVCNYCGCGGFSPQRIYSDRCASCDHHYDDHA